MTWRRPDVPPRWWTVAGAGLVGLAAGGLTALALQSVAAPGAAPDAGTTDAPGDPRPGPTTASGRPTVTPRLAPVPTPDEELLLAWTPGGLPDDLAATVEALPAVTDVTVVRGDRVDLAGSTTANGAAADRLEPGWRIPLDVLGVDPAGYAAVLSGGGKTTVAQLAPGQAVLSETGARLRGLGAGATLDLGGTTVTVTAVVDDVVAAGAEVVLHRDTGTAVGASTPRFLLLRHDGERTEVEAAIRGAAPEGVALRLRAAGETPFLRHADAVLTMAQIKDRFGEFAYRPPAGERGFTIDPAFEEAHVVTADVPILGQVRCHRAIVEQVRGALRELDDRGLAHLIDPDDYAGCYVPRLTGPGGYPSRHAWGVAMDLNYDAERATGLSATQDERLVDTLRRWGFTWGGPWLVPDPAHFEYIAPPAAGEPAPPPRPGAGRGPRSGFQETDDG